MSMDERVAKAGLSLRGLQPSVYGRPARRRTIANVRETAA